MASTNKTTNYELSQFEGTDKPSWEADYNADMLSIDTNLKAVSDVADGASGSISSLADRVTTAEGNITTNANDIDALEARADALEAGETAADGRLDAIEAEQLLQNTAIEGNTQLGYNLARPYDSASTYSVGDYVLFQNTLYKCTTAVTTGEAFDPTKWLAIKATDEIAAGGYTLPIASANDLGGVKVGSNLSIDANGILSGAPSYTLPIASANDLGGVKVGNNLTIDNSGVLSASGWVEDANAYIVFEQTTTGHREEHIYKKTEGNSLYLKVVLDITNMTIPSATGADTPVNIKIYNFDFPLYTSTGIDAIIAKGVCNMQTKVHVTATPTDIRYYATRSNEATLGYYNSLSAWRMTGSTFSASSGFTYERFYVVFDFVLAP